MSPQSPSACAGGAVPCVPTAWGRCFGIPRVPASRIVPVKLRPKYRCSQSPKPPALHLPSHLRIWGASGTVQTVLPPALGFCPAPPAFPRCYLQDIAFNIKASAPQHSSPLQASGVQLPVLLPGLLRSRKMCAAVKGSRAAARPFFN